MRIRTKLAWLFYEWTVPSICTLILLWHIVIHVIRTQIFRIILRLSKWIFFLNALIRHLIVVYFKIFLVYITFIIHALVFFLISLRQFIGILFLYVWSNKYLVNQVNIFLFFLHYLFGLSCAQILLNVTLVLFITFNIRVYKFLFWLFIRFIISIPIILFHFISFFFYF